MRGFLPGLRVDRPMNVLSTNLPAAILVAVLLIFWQAAAMGIDAAYILPSPTQVVVRLWELRGPLFTAHLPATCRWWGSDF